MQSNDDSKTPLNFYEIAIAELAKTQENLQLELDELKIFKSRYQTLDAELKNSHSKIERLEKELQETKKEVTASECNTKKLQNQVSLIEEENNNNKLEMIKFKDSLQPVRIESGVFSGNTKKTEGWNENLYGKQGRGRIFREKICFEKNFIKTPEIMLGISYADVKKGANYRLRVSAKNVTVNGFDLEIHTWLDTQVWGADVNWLAYGY